ncbi:MAG TPA: 50S ribosomal protein L3 N(5)-glutamine methyltransferase [Beijerinckiaceae bacterium]|nr:50S ribosomal protein L3 N(5)-glutamine methyltransferase [Beijerinckiaceae bacterium]
MTNVPPELATLRDFLRYAVSRFRAAKLAFGHGTANAHDEAAFLLLEALHLPIDRLDPYLDARLTGDERQRIADLIEARITTRKPACYLLNKAYIQGIPFYVDERVIVPRSYIGEMLMGGLFEDGPLADERDPAEVGRVLDLCTGSGCLAILAAHVFPNATIDAADLSRDALKVARRNVDEHGLEDRVALIESDLFSALKGRRYDLILTNPPYVTAAEVAAFPPEYAAEPQMAHLGGADGMDLVRTILKDAKKHLNPGGGLLCEIGLGREIIESEYADIPFLWLDSEESEGEVFWLQKEELP